MEGDASPWLQPRCTVTLEHSDRVHRVFRAPPLRGSDAAPQRPAYPAHPPQLSQNLRQLENSRVPKQNIWRFIPSTRKKMRVENHSKPVKETSFSFFLLLFLIDILEFFALVLTLKSRQFLVTEDKANTHAAMPFFGMARCIVATVMQSGILPFGHLWWFFLRICKKIWGVGCSRLSVTGSREPQSDKPSDLRLFVF